ncbi:MAG: hypothetical protein ABMB14_26205 [Myxococcota bacterium]
MNRLSFVIVALVAGCDVADEANFDASDADLMMKAPKIGAILRSTGASIPLADQVATPVLSAVAGAGNWVVTGKATAVNFGDADYARCVLLAGGVQVDASATLVGNASPGFTGELGPSAATLVVQAVVPLVANTTIEMQCLHDGFQTGVYLDPGASLRMFKSAGAQSAVNGGAVNVSTFGSTTVASLKRKNVQVAIFGKATPVSFADNDYVRGTLETGGAILDASATLIGVGASGPTGERGPSAATVEMLGLHAFGPVKATLSLGVVHDFATQGIYVDPAASLITVPSTSAELTTSSAATVLATDGSNTEAVATVLPAGNYALSAKATAVNFGAADYVRCVLLEDGAQLDASTTLVGNAAPGFTGELGPSAATLGVQSIVTSTGVETYSLSCGHDNVSAGEYLDPGAALLAVPVTGKLDIQ